MKAPNPIDEIRFWSRQLSEHALFFSMGLEVEPYRSQAAAIHNDWETARTKLSSSDLANARAIIGPVTTNLRDWQTGVIALLETRWLGWLSPLFWWHTMRELQYFVARAWYGGWPADTTLQQNLQFMREHAEFAAHLLDPAARDLITGAVDCAKTFADVEQGCCASITPALLELSTRAGNKLDAYLTQNPISSPALGTIHPVLADHVVREGKRFLITMQEFGE